MSVQERKERERAERERLIVATARELAEQQGWDAVTTRRLAERIEYSQPVLYSHFRGKREIIGAVALEGAAELAAAVRAATAAADGPRERVARPRPRLPRLRRTQPGGLRRHLPARRRSGVRAGGHPGTSQGRLRRAAGVPRRGRRGRRRPGAVHRGVLGVPARGGDPDPVGTAAAGGRRAEGGAAGGPARHGLTHRPGGHAAVATRRMRCWRDGSVWLIAGAAFALAPNSTAPAFSRGKTALRSAAPRGVPAGPVLRSRHGHRSSARRRLPFG